MNHTKFISRSFALILAILVVSGCGVPVAEQIVSPCPTTAPQSCPTTAAQVEPDPDSWVKHYRSFTNLRITFDPGNKCSLDVFNHPMPDLLTYEIVVNDQTYQHYVVSAVTLAEGKTLQDFDEASKATVGVVAPPSFATLETIEVVTPRSWSIHLLRMPKSRIYLACLVEGPVQQQVIQTFGPVEIP